MSENDAISTAAMRARALAGEIGSGLLELVWPTRCICCDLPGTLLCDRCRSELPLIDQRDACPSCGAPFGRIACTECWTRDGMLEFPFSAAACAAEFSGTAARLAVVYKDRGERRLAGLMSELIAEAVEARWACGSGSEREHGGIGARETAWMPEAVIAIPATRQAIRRRGFDHIQPVAEELARRWGLPAMQALTKSDAADQRELGRSGRFENMSEAFSLHVLDDRLPRTALLVDDVFTTGATLSAAASTLLEAGVEEVRVAALCRVW